MLPLFHYWDRQHQIVHFQMFEKSIFDKFMWCMWKNIFFFKMYIQMLLHHSHCHGGVNKLCCQTNRSGEINSVQSLWPCVSLLEEVKVESPVVLLQARRWARPHQVPLWWAPLSPRMWPLWLWLPWFWVAQPQAAPHSTFPLASRVRLDRSMTTVSHKSTILLFMPCLDLSISFKMKEQY